MSGWYEIDIMHCEIVKTSLLSKNIANVDQRSPIETILIGLIHNVNLVVNSGFGKKSVHSRSEFKKFVESVSKTLKYESQALVIVIYES